MSSGKKKKSKSKPSSMNWTLVFSVVLGALIMCGLMAGGYYVMGQRKAIVGYDESVAKVTEVLRTRDPDSAQGALKLSEIEALVVGSPTITRETKDDGEYAVYTWSGAASPVGFRLKIEKNGPIEEVAELITLGAQ